MFLEEDLGLLSLLIGYLIGSVSPAYILGKILKGIDIREHGSKNAGTANVYHVLGLWPAVITAFYDVFKGLIAMLIAYLLKAPPIFVFMSGIAAIIGHVFPFYLQFHGGLGVATSVGLLLFYLTLLLKNHWLPISSLLVIGGFSLGFIIIFRKGDIVGLLVLPVVLWLILQNSPAKLLNIFAAVVIGYIMFINLYNIYRYKYYKLKPETKEAISHIRVLLRPLAISFPILYLFLKKKTILTIIGIPALLFILVDIIRLVSQKVNIFIFQNLLVFFREKEKHTFSSATLFLISCFLTILLFAKSIATMAIIFLIFGDIFAKFTGLEHGKTRIFTKTLRGSLAYFATCLIAGYVWSHFVPLSFLLILIGSLAAALTELLPIGVSDNLMVPMVSASVMTLAKIF